MAMHLNQLEFKSVLKLVTLHNGDKIVLLSYDDLGSQDAAANLIRLDADGQQNWKATPLAKPDAFTEFWIDGEKLTAHVWSGFICEIDLDTGKILASRFAK